MDSSREDKNKLRNKKIIEKVIQWQNFKFIKPLTCQNPSCQNKVVPKESHGKVILVCPKCNSKQSYVPKAVIQTSLSFPEKLKKNSLKQIDRSGL